MIKRKILLVVLAILVCIVIGCGKPETADTGQKVITSGCNELQAKYDVLQSNYDSLKKASEGNKDANERYNAQVNELHALQVEKAVRESQIESLTAQYNAVVNALSGKQADSLKALEQMNEQLNLTRERNNIINEQIQKVRTEKVALLSDNLTDAEYETFYKGWDLWWGSFND